MLKNFLRTLRNMDSQLQFLLNKNRHVLKEYEATKDSKSTVKRDGLGNGECSKSHGEYHRSKRAQRNGGHSSKQRRPKIEIFIGSKQGLRHYKLIFCLLVVWMNTLLWHRRKRWTRQCRSCKRQPWIEWRG